MKIEELEESETYSFDGVILNSYMLADICKKCNNNLFYDYRFDASFCPHCNEWVEDPCDMNESVHDEMYGGSDADKAKYPLAKKIPEKPLDRPKGIVPEDDYFGNSCKSSVEITID